MDVMLPLLWMYRGGVVEKDITRALSVAALSDTIVFRANMSVDTFL